MMLEVRNGTVHRRNKAACIVAERIWNARNHATPNPRGSVMAQTMAAYFSVLA